jgi:acetate kinase
MRRRICQGLDFLGLQLDDDLNEVADGRAAMRISKDSGVVQIWVIPTDEERQIARSAYEQLRN